jgi:hypothetical protein
MMTDYVSIETRLEEIQASLDCVISLIENTQQGVIQVWTLPAAMKLSRSGKVKCYLPNGEIIVVKSNGKDYEIADLQDGDIAHVATVGSYDALDVWVYTWTLTHRTAQQKIWLPI